MDKQLLTWVEVPEKSDFSIYNLPFGIFSVEGGEKKIGIAIGDQLVDLVAFHEAGLLDDLKLDRSVFSNTYLNDFISLGKHVTSKVRERVQMELCDPASVLKNHQSAILRQSSVKMHMPVQVGDYTDFYSSIEHATNVGKMFRDPENALLPNWKHIPVGYHGRASSIVLSGTEIRRPKGQTKPAEGPPEFGPTRRLDFELEMAFIVGKETSLGDTIPVSEAMDYIFGMVIFNDWSARDMQKWEYVPLGPFLAKSFASSISPWVVTMEALESFTVEGPEQDPPVLPYLQSSRNHNYDINLEVGITPEASSEKIVSRSNYKFMYWDMAQQLAHHTVNGCNVKVGDMMASGTISGKDETAYGSMLELTWAGSNPLKMNDNSDRKFLLDGDTVSMRAYSERDGKRVGFGEVSGKIVSAEN